MVDLISLENMLIGELKCLALFGSKTFFFGNLITLYVRPDAIPFYPE